MSEPFTPERVHEILTEVIQTGLRPPLKESPEVRALTHRLNLLHGIVKYRRDQMPGEVREAQAFAWALRILAGPLPNIRGSLVASLEAAERWGADMDRDLKRAAEVYGADLKRPEGGSVARAKARLETLDALQAAAEAAKELPVYPFAYVMGKPVEHWKDYTEDLIKAFKDAAGGSIEAAYRFVAETTPEMTGEKKPPLNAVKCAVKYRHRKSRVKQA
jgi:hypothetical protein